MITVTGFCGVDLHGTKAVAIASLGSGDADVGAIGRSDFRAH
jgi:hypothetical protein